MSELQLKVNDTTWKVSVPHQIGKRDYILEITTEDQEIKLRFRDYDFCTLIEFFKSSQHTNS